MSAKLLRVKIERCPKGFSPYPQFKNCRWCAYVSDFPDPSNRAYYSSFELAKQCVERDVKNIINRRDPVTGISLIRGMEYQVAPPKGTPSSYDFLEAILEKGLDVLKKNRPYKHSLDAGQLKAQRRKRAARIRAGRKAQREAEDRLDRIVVAVARKEAERMYITPEDVSIPSTWWRQAAKIRETYLH